MVPRNAKKVGLSKYAGRFAASSTLIPGTTARSSGAGRGVADGDSLAPVCRSTPPLPWVLPVGATIHPGGAVGHHADAEPRLSSDHLNRLLGQGPKAGARVCGVGKREDQPGCPPRLTLLPRRRATEDPPEAARVESRGARTPGRVKDEDMVPISLSTRRSSDAREVSLAS